MFPFWVEVSLDMLIQLSVMGLAGLACLIQTCLCLR